MNGASATAFLPNFVGFPSPRGLHSSTVPSESAPIAPTCAFTPPSRNGGAPHANPEGPGRATVKTRRRTVRTRRGNAVRRPPQDGEAPAGSCPGGRSWCRTAGRRSPSGAQLPRVSCLRRIRLRPRLHRRTSRPRRTSRRRTRSSPTSRRSRSPHHRCRRPTSCRSTRGSGREAATRRRSGQRPPDPRRSLRRTPPG